MAASTECSTFSAAIAFSLGRLGLSHVSLKKEQRSAILAEYQRRDVSPNRVPWKEYVLPVSTFPSTRKMGQNVLAKQSWSCLVSPPMFGRH